jgi:hypothetical protein
MGVRLKLEKSSDELRLWYDDCIIKLTVMNQESQIDYDYDSILGEYTKIYKEKEYFENECSQYELFQDTQLSLV